MTELVSYRCEQAISVITLDDGKANALSPAMLAAINAALDQAERDRGVVILRGRDGVFSGGFDLKIIKGGDSAAISTMLEGGAALAERLLSFPLPTLAACTGHAIAMGFFVLLCCDHRIGMRAEHRFAANEVAIGMTVPRFAAQVCRQRLTPAAFNSGLATAHFFDSSNALLTGCLDQMVPADQFEAAVAEKARQLTTLDMESHTATKLRIREQLLRDMRSAIEADCSGWRSGYGI